jgi:hypothetical protein
MKKSITYISFMLGLLLGLSACATAIGATPQADDSLLSTDYENALSVPMQLAVGTLKLDGTGQEVGAEAAADLLPLWKAVRSLSSSDSAAPEELEAIYAQIEESMAPEQVQAIAAMKLTPGEIAQVAQEMGLSMGPAGGGPNATGQQTGQRGLQTGGEGAAPPAGGGPPSGGMDPGMGGGPPPNFSSSDDDTQTRTQRGPGTALYDAVIQYLEGKIES